MRDAIENCEKEKASRTPKDKKHAKVAIFPGGLFTVGRRTKWKRDYS